MLKNPTFWVGVSFVLFFVVAWKAGAFKALFSGLDARGQRVAQELAEAQRLRSDAEALMKDFETKRRAAEAEAKAIVRAARVDAERMAAEAEAKLSAFIERRTAAAEAKIAQAETQAFAEVRAVAADAALKAAETILRDQVAGKGSDAMVVRGLTEIKARLN
jgi:F-type H+-transporting ATPase subunit b